MSKTTQFCRFSLTGVLLAGFAYPSVPNCGDVITLSPATPYVLTGNVGPCINGLRLNGQGVFHLNGFSLQGSFSSAGGATGLYLENVSQAVIKGPGSILNFNAAVVIPHGSAGIVVQDVAFLNNRNALAADLSADLHFRNNRIERGDRGDWGITLTSCSRVKIKDNSIRGHIFGGVSIGHSIDVILTRNDIRNNLDGVVATASGELGLLLLGNTVNSNYRDGVSITGQGGPPYLAVAEGNNISYNYRDGLSLVGGPSVSCRAEDNRVYVNSRYGIYVTAGWNVLENWVSRSGLTDLYWTGGPATMFAFNQCKTTGATSPAVPPSCLAP